MTDEQTPAPPAPEAPEDHFARIRPTLEKLMLTLEHELNDSDGSLVLQLMLAKNAVRNGMLPTAVIASVQQVIGPMMAMWRDAEQEHKQ